MNQVSPAEIYAAHLPHGRLMTFDLTPLDRLNVPVSCITLLKADGTASNGIGYGLNDESAQIGAFGELSEELWSSRLARQLDSEKGSYREMVERHGQDRVIDPASLCLEAGCPYTVDLSLEWMAAKRYSTGEPVYIPAEFVTCFASDYHFLFPNRQPLITPVRNGSGAGNNFDQAFGHALLELLQRDGNSVCYRALARGSALDLETVTDPISRALIAKYQAAGIELRVKLASTDFGFANIYVVGADLDPDKVILPVMGFACGEAVHPCKEMALRKALLEFAASRARLAFFHGPRKSVAGVATPEYMEHFFWNFSLAGEDERSVSSMSQWFGAPATEVRKALTQILDVDRCIPFADLPSQMPLSEAEIRQQVVSIVVSALTKAGFDLLFVDLSPKSTGDVHVVKAVVPGLEVETMSYGRIGFRNVSRLLSDPPPIERGQKLVGLGPARTGVKPVHLTATDRQQLGDDAWFDLDLSRESVGNLYSLYREPSAHVCSRLLEVDR